MNPLITATLFELVKSMREAQTEYFRDRGKDALLKAKYLEEKVDSLIKAVDGKNQKGSIK